MKISHAFPVLLLAAPLMAQQWDVRLEVPFPEGQSLPQTFIEGTGKFVEGKLNTGNGYIVTASHRIIRVGPVLKFEWSAEYSLLQADGHLQQGATNSGSKLNQKGFGLGLNAQFWVPFTGLAAEFGVIGRVQTYRYEGGGVSQDETLYRPWMRVGLRWNLPFPGVSPYLCASYQQPITQDRPMVVNNAQDLQNYFNAQGAGQEFQRLWSFGGGVSF